MSKVEGLKSGMNEKAQNTAEIYVHDVLRMQWLRQVKPNDSSFKKWFPVIRV
jgi:hypothetical protein